MRLTRDGKKRTIEGECYMVEYIVRAARDEETNEGWIWMKFHPSRTVVKITKRPKPCWQFWQRRSVYCQVRNFDQNFLGKYNNNQSRRIKIPCKNRESTIVMSQWYRDALGGFGTTNKDNKTGKVELCVKPAKLAGWRSVRAACHHPDIVVRLGTRLGVLGLGLGIVGFAPVVTQGLELGAECSRCVILAIALLIGLLACRGPRRPLA